MNTKVFALIPLLFALSPFASGGDVYKTIDADGNIIYTDAPPATGAEPIDLPEPSTYTPVRAHTSSSSSRSSTPKTRDTSTVKYQNATMSAPQQEQVVPNGQTSVNAAVSLTPGLNPGHKVQFTLDGTDVGSASASTSTSIGSLNRGTHTVGARVIDESGTTLISAPAVTIHVQRPKVGG